MNRVKDVSVFTLALCAGLIGGVTVLACCCAGVLQLFAWLQEWAGVNQCTR